MRCKCFGLWRKSFKKDYSFPVGAGAAFSLALTGLSTDSLGSYGQVGNHAAIGYTTDAPGTVTVKWSTNADETQAATNGTGTAPTAFTDGQTIYLHLFNDAAFVRTVSFVARYAPGTAPAIADGQAWTVDDTSVNINAAASGANLTWSYVLTGSTAGVTINPSTGAITGTPTGVDSGTATITATDQYGREVSDTFTWSAALRAQATAADGLGPFSWTVDDTSVNVDATTDFTTGGNTLTYTATGLPAGVTIASNGIISGTPTAASSGAIVITGQDEYGRETTSTTSHTTSLRTQATGGADLDLAYPEDSAISTQNLLANWTLNGNTPTTLVSLTPSLPTGLSAAIVGNAVNLTGTPTTVTADATYTLTIADEYGRQTSDTFTLEITEVDVTDPVIDSATWTAATQSLSVGVTEGGPDPDTVDIYVASYSGAAPSDAQVKAGTGGTILEAYDAQNTTGLTDQDLGFTATSDGDRGLAIYVEDDAGNSARTNIASAIIATTAPSLSSPTAAKNGSDGATSLGVTTNKMNGTLYWGIYPTASTPSAADVVAGTGATVNGSQAVSATGVQSVSDQTGLSASTAYKAHYVHDDVASNRSAVSTSAEFTTDAGGYTQTLFDTNDTAYVGRNYTGAGDAVTGINEFELSVWLNYNSAANLDMIFQFRNGSYLQFGTGNALRLYLEEGDGTTGLLAPTLTTTTLSSGTLYHIYLYANANNGNLQFRINGASDASIPDNTWTITPSADTFYTTLQWNPFAIHSGGQIPDLVFGDFWLETNAGTQRGVSTFYNGGTPPDLSLLGVTPDIWIGGDLTVSQLNAGTQKGDRTPWYVGSGTFT